MFRVPISSLGLYKVIEDITLSCEKKVYVLFTHSLGSSFVCPVRFKVLVSSSQIQPFKKRIAETEEKMKVLRAFLKSVIDDHRQTFDANNLRDYIDGFLHEGIRLAELREAGKPVEPLLLDRVFQEDQLVGCLMDLFLAGSETTSKTLSWACLFMVGGHELVNLSHRPSLPYTDATLTEITRLGQVGPLASVRCPNVDAQIGGFTIKKGKLRFSESGHEI